MTDLEQLAQWLVTFPLWGEEILHTGCHPAATGSCLLSQDTREVSRQADILGNVTVRCQSRFVLFRVMAPQEETAQWLGEFFSWVQQQSAQGLAPTFGDCPRQERLLAQTGKQPGLELPAGQVCRVELTAEYDKKF